jgi:hypothetical protein
MGILAVAAVGIATVWYMATPKSYVGVPDYKPVPWQNKESDEMKYGGRGRLCSIICRPAKLISNTAYIVCVIFCGGFMLP